MQLADQFDLLEQLHDGRAVVVYRALQLHDRAPVILKVPKRGVATPDRQRHEYAILRELDLPGVVRARGLLEQGSEVALVLDDLGGRTLAARLAEGPLALREALRIAIEIANTLGQIHHRRVIHKDINPSNLLLDARGRALVFDFDIATRLPREIQSIRTPNLLAGTLLYISPEQTGRMNRAIDYRTDLYSFGVTLYAMLTGRVPFPSRDPMELIHAHIARIPAPPAEIDPSIPAAVSDVVMKLLEKTAEARYQTAAGLKADLERCAAELDAAGRVDRFPLGRRDVSGRFQIPEKLYGRQDAINALGAALARAHHGTPELLLVTGRAGIGKSRVIHELGRVTAQARGLFVAGKFDQLKRNIPYSALLQALAELVRGLLTGTDEELAACRARILDAVVGQGRVLTDVLPDLARVIGPQPPIQELPGAEAGNRFRYVFERFIHAFTRAGTCAGTRAGEPLVLFLDDLQWADAATLGLLTSLLSDKRPAALLVIGAYRDDEVSGRHPLLSAIAEIEASGRPATRLALGPISAEDVCELVRDTLSLDRDEASPLAEALWKRTGGNPLFVGELLTMLHRNGLIEFDPDRGRFTFDLDRIARAEGPGSLGQLMAARAGALAASTQEMLRLAAVIGNRFELDTLALVSQRSPDQAAEALNEALEEGLLLYLGDRDQRGHATYRFLHDRVQQAVYAAIPEDEKIAIHLRAGKLLFASRPEDEDDAWLFGVLHHLNLAAASVEDPAERALLARLNLTAANRARASGAFVTAAAHCAAGIGFMPEPAWESQRDLMFSMHLLQAECEYLGGAHAAAERLFEVLGSEARTPIEQVEIHELVAVYKQHVWRLDEAVAAGIKALDLLDIKVAPDAKPIHVLLEFLKTRRAIGRRSPRELARNREATDARVELSLRVLGVVANAAFFTNPNLYGILGLKGVPISVAHGNSRYSSTGYITYGLMLIAILGDHDEGEAFAGLARDLCEKAGDKLLETRFKLAYGMMIHPWRHPARESLVLLDEARQCGLLSGELVFACYAACGSAVLLSLMGRPLDALRKTLEDDLQLVRKLKHDAAERTLQSFFQMTLSLAGQTRRPGSFDTDDFDEEKHAAALVTVETKTPLYVYWVAKLVVLYILDRHDEALAISDMARKDVDKVLGLVPSTVEYHLYDALLSTALLDERPEKRGRLARQRELLRVRAHLRKLKRWAENAPMNFRHKHLLVAAELARVTGDDRAAMRAYEQAMAAARENEAVQDEALGHELASKFYRSRGLQGIAIDYLARARHAYARWNAHAKVALLDAAYPGLAARDEAGGRAAGEAITTTSTSSGGAFDVSSMIKASQALSGEVSLDRLLLRLMNIVVENAGAERGLLLLKEQGVAAIVAEFGPERGAALLPEKEPLAESARLSLGIGNYVFRTRESVVLRDAAREGAFVTDPYVASRDKKAILCMPLLQKGEVVGALYLENNLVPGAFTEERAELLGVLCAQMVISIDNARLYDHLEQKVAERTSALTRAQARVVQLEKEATETQMAGGFAHEMRNALAGAKMMISTVYRSSADATWSLSQEGNQRLKELYLYLRERLDDEGIRHVADVLRTMDRDAVHVDKVLGGVDRALVRGLGITGAILDYAQIGRSSPGSDRVAFAEIAASVLEELGPSLKALRITTEVQIPPACLVQGSRRHLRSILMNLVQNARDAMEGLEETRPRTLEVRVHEEPGRHVLSVRDSGMGIPPELHEKIFEPFFSTKPRSGTGLGLGMVRKIAALYGGTVELDSAPGRGTTFRVTFPERPLRSGAQAPLRATADREDKPMA